MPIVLAVRQQKRVGHGAADDQRVDFLQQVAEQIELGGNLGAADDRRQRARRVVERLVEGFELGLHAAPGIGRQHMAEAFGRGVRAVRGREGVVDPDVAELGERGDEGGIVLLLAGMKARVLQADDVARLHRGDRALGRLADAVVDEFDRPLDDARDFGGDRLERVFRIAALRPAEMREQDHLAALVGDLGDGGAARSMRVASVTTPFSTGTLRSTRTSTRLPFTSTWSRVRNAVMRGPARFGRLDQLAHRHGGVGHAVGEAPFVVVPAITRTSVPSITLVWSMWKIEECGSWLKSIETLGCVGVAEDALELLLGGALDRGVDLVLGGRASWRRT